MKIYFKKGGLEVGKAFLLTVMLIVASIFVGGLVAVGAAEDTWPCEVLLCLSNPAGPKAVTECVPPINKLEAEMKKPRFQFPECKDANDAGTRAVMNQACYDVCPSGYGELPGGMPALSQAAYDGGKLGGSYYTDDGEYIRWKGTVNIGLADEKACTAASLFSNNASQTKTCVKNLRNTVNLYVATGADDGGNYKYSLINNVGVYEDVIVLQPFGTSSVVDIYIDGAFYKRVPLYL